MIIYEDFRTGEQRVDHVYSHSEFWDDDVQKKIDELLQDKHKIISIYNELTTT